MEAVLRYLIDHFQDLLEVNLTASIVILFVICARLFLKRAPKIFSYALWAIVLLRLLVPISIESSVSVVPERTEFAGVAELNEAMPRIEFESPVDRANNQWIRENTPPGEPFTQTSRCLDAQTYLAFVWLIGMTVMLTASTVSYGKLRKRVRVCVPFRKGIYIADEIDTPFVMGIFRPVIYLPGTLDMAERKYIIAHERHHIHRGDHIFKALGFLALTIHWFNPLVWVAFVLAGRDMEMSCDEAVIRKYGEEIRAEYSASLLNLATGHRLFSGTPLAFGEGNPTGRIRNLAKWKKPAFWVILVCVLVCVILSICLLTNPIQENLGDMTMTHGPASVGVGELEFAIPQGFSIAVKESDAQRVDIHPYEHVIWRNHEVVGGVYILKSSDPDLYGTWDWVETLNIPENVPEDRFIISVSYVDFLDDVTYNMAVSYGKAGIEETVHYLFRGEENVYDLWFDRAYLTDSDMKSILDSARMPEGETSVPAEYWGVSLTPERVTRTGAHAIFSYGGTIPGEEEAELTYGDYLSLDRLVYGQWIPCDELAGYDYYVGDSSYPVVDGYGMVHEWPERFGELPDGHYRLGKQVTLVRPDGTSENRMVYGEFWLPDSVQTGMIPLDQLPERYSAEQAMLDGCYVSADGVARENKELFHDFAVCSQNGMPGVIRLVNWNYGEDSQCSVMDLRFDGTEYTLTSRSNTYTFRYLNHYTGEKAWENADHDAFDYYILVNDDSVTFEDIMSGKLDMSDWKNPAHWTVYANFIYRPKQPQLPMNPAQAVLEFEGKSLVTITDFDRLEKIWILFQEAEYLGYEPKTHSVGVGLNLILTSQNGETMTIELDPDSDICRIDGEYVFYGAYDELDYIEKLWYYLGIPQWPEPVYTAYPNALKP